jgi:stearoyl-CoA desaturase (delta-9 desaturase)
VRDWLRYPELRYLDRYDWVVPVLLIAGLWIAGAWLDASAPYLGVTGAQLVVWGFAISTVAVYHVTYTINSLAHRFGRRRFATRDDSRNNAVLAILTMGEGWHNNHHHYPASTRQGFYWLEIDLTYYGLVLLSWTGLIWNLRPVPAHVLDRNRVDVSARAGLS